MQKKIFSISVIFFFTCWIFAQNQNATPQVAPIIEKLLDKYQTISSISIHFNMEMKNNSTIIQNLKGMIHVKNEKYYLTFDDVIMANDGKMIWNYQKSINEVSFFDTKEDDFSIFPPTKMLQNWNKEFDAKFIREEEMQKKQRIIVDLKPKKQSSFYKIRLVIDKSTSYIHQIIMYEPDNTTITYTITKFTPNATIADAQFIFNKNDYPHVQINDMR